MATWASVKRQARTRLGINLTDPDLLDIPMLATGPYGEFIPGPHGLPQLVRTGPDAADDAPRGHAADPGDVPADVAHFDTPFVGDIAHNADPSPRHNPDDSDDPDGGHRHRRRTTRAAARAGTYDDEMLDTHFCAGDGRVNENIALTTIHQVFHSEHDRLVGDIKNTLTNDGQRRRGVTAFRKAGVVDDTGWNGDRLFQAARFVTEMEYQHLVFEEFARKVQPAVRPFHVYHSDLNPVIPAEFAHAVYRFGHSMLDDDVARMTEDANGVKTDNSLPLLDSVPQPAGVLQQRECRAAVHAGAGRRRDRHGLVGPGRQRARRVRDRDAAQQPARSPARPADHQHDPRSRGGRAVAQQRAPADPQQTNDGQLAPYTDWSDYGQHLKHPESLVNYVAAYGEHPTITRADEHLDGRCKRGRSAPPHGRSSIRCRRTRSRPMPLTSCSAPARGPTP